MKFLHTADWHLGQHFYDYDRFDEHQTFLDWLLQLLENQGVEVLLVSGDVFDSANPSVASVRQFYQFLSKITMQLPDIQVIIIAGNHDSPVRLEMPQPLLENTNIHLIGFVKRKEDKTIDYQALTIPLKNKKGEIEVFCLAVPFLRLGDFPSFSNEENSNNPTNYGQKISAFYHEISEFALSQCAENQAVIAMGHLHAQGANIPEDDTAERNIIGGIEAINASDFNKNLSYVALGHIHKAQQLTENQAIRYSGSPIPLSFSEKNYKHQVIVFEISNKKIKNLQQIEVPKHTELISIPEKHKEINEVLTELKKLPEKETSKNSPFLEVKVLLNEPLPELKNRIMEAISSKNVRLVRIDAILNNKPKKEIEKEDNSLNINNLTPFNLLEKIYQSSYDEPLPSFYKSLLNEVLTEIETNENTKC